MNCNENLICTPAGRSNSVGATHEQIGLSFRSSCYLMQKSCFFHALLFKGSRFHLGKGALFVLCCSVCGPTRPDSFIYHFFLCCAVHTLRLLRGCRLTFKVALIEFWTVGPVSNAPREIKEIFAFQHQRRRPCPLALLCFTIYHNTMRSK